MSKPASPSLHSILVFCDGASSGNPGPGGYGVILVTPEGQVRELGGRDPATTNNRMELSAAIAALQELRNTPGPVEIHTDSVYVIRGITEWIWAWRKRGWKTAEGGEVLNTDLWNQLSALIAARGKENPVRWRFVRGHSGVPGNERVDEIAVAFSSGRRPSLYHGPLLKYDVPVHDLPEDMSLPERKPREGQGPKPSAHSYLSLLGGTAVRHKSWAECERRVKGQSGAKFKKAMSEAEEREILRSWGVDPKQVREL